MKVRAAIILLFIFSSTCFAQNFTPFKNKWIYQFSRTNGDTITSFRIDSLYLQGNDSVFIFNPISRYTEEEFNDIDSNNIFGKKMIRKANGDCIFIFNQSDSILIKPNAALNTTWVFSKLQNISARMAEDSITKVFNHTDSIHVIILSDGNKIIISKNYGFVATINFDSYYGLASANPLILDALPNINEGIFIGNPLLYYDFEKGEKFFFQESGWGPGYGYQTSTRIEILDRTNFSADSIQYKVKRDSKSNASSGVINSVHDTIYTNISTNYIINGFFGESSLFAFKYKLSNSFLDSYPLTLIALRSKKTNVSMLRTLDPNDFSSDIYTQGLGNSYSDTYYEGSGGSISRKLLCVYKSSDIQDSCKIEDDFIANISQAQSEAGFKILNHLNELEIMPSENNHQLYSIEIRDVMGNSLYKTEDNHGSTTINISQLKSDLYILTVLGKKRVIYKFLK